MPIMSESIAYIVLVLFAIIMIVATTMLSKEKFRNTTVGFMAAGRNVPWWLGAISISVSWIWAPALFVSVQQAYQQGIPGIFWFSFPNILCLIIIAPLAVRIRRNLPDGYSQPEWIRFRFDEKTHKLYLIPFFWYQLMAVTVQLYAGGSIFSFLTGIPVINVMVILAVTTLIYGTISGMRASIITDFLQYALIILGGLLVIPWTISSAGGFQAVVGGFGGISGKFKDLLNPQVAFNFGIVTSIGLISGVLSDQQHWQRAFTINKKTLVRAYVFAGFLFGIVPIGLSTLGFLGANASVGVSLPAGADPSMIGVAVVAKFLPTWAVGAFLIMLLGGLCSTLDSGMCAASSLYALNCFPFTPEEKSAKEKEKKREELSNQEKTILSNFDKKTVKRGRIAMYGITLAGFLVAIAVLYIPNFGLQYLWWVFNTIAACVAVPTILSLYWKRLDSKGVFWGVLIAFFIGIPLFIYSNIVGNILMTVLSSVGILLITSLFAFLFPRKDDFPLIEKKDEIGS